MTNKRVLVSFVSEQTVPIYLFIKTMFQPGDEILLISSNDNKMEQSVDNLKKTLNWGNAPISTITLKKKGDEEIWNQLTSQLKPAFHSDNQYLVGINGGTKLMNLALFEILSSHNRCNFYYIPYPKNAIVDIKSNNIIDITYRLTIHEHVSLHGHTLLNCGGCIRSLEANNVFFQHFVNGYDKTVLDALYTLRTLRGKRSDIGDNADVRRIYNQLAKKKTIEINEIPDATEMMRHFEFVSQKEGLIDMEEICYITGGWFEEWTFQQIKEHLKLDDEHIAIGGHLDSPDGNELDVAFTYNNSLYVVECKSGIDKLGELKSYLQKANSIKSNLKALSAKSVIFGISNDAQQWHDAAEYLGLKYMSKNQLVDPVERFNFI